MSTTRPSPLARRLLANQVIERWAVGPIEPTFVDAAATADTGVELVDIDGLDDDALAALNRERGLSLDPAELHAIAAHYRARRPRPHRRRAGDARPDVERALRAQDVPGADHRPTTARAITPLLQQLRDATDADRRAVRAQRLRRQRRHRLVRRGTTLAVKAETHNHPSAIEPFGGANTGVGGVIRDVMGTSHRPIAVTDILCFGPTDLARRRSCPRASCTPGSSRAASIAGVADYGNKIGLPTVAGAVLYDPGYTANPLVYCGCIGVAADAAAARPARMPGDLVVVLGGRTGRDGLRGATFSSATMDATTGDVAGASVQIGDPITEKLLIDVLAEAAGTSTPRSPIAAPAACRRRSARWPRASAPTSTWPARR